METRSDRIVTILAEAGGRLSVKDVADRLARLEGVPSLITSAVSATVTQDNKTRDAAGRTPRFKTYGDGTEQWGYVSLVDTTKPAKITEPEKLHERIPQFMEAANRVTRDRLRKAVAELTWQEFESNFLARVLEALGFHSVELTQLTRDGGKDAFCRYKRGIVSSEAIVSAKHWSGNKVGAAEVQRLRGIKGSADTGIIVTSSQFTEDAKQEAEPSQNQRSIVLIDGELIVETCIATGIGIRAVNLPTLYDFVGLRDDRIAAG